MKFTLRKKLFILILMFIIASVSTISLAYRYKKDGKLPPIKLTYNDFNRILSSLRSQIPITSDDKFDKVSEEITISDNNITITKDKNLIFSESDRIPRKATSLSYSYKYSKGEITKISIRLDESRRYISIEGPSADSVEAIRAFLHDQFSKHKIILGGRKFRIVGCMILLAIALAFWSVSCFSEKISLKVKVTYAIIACVIYLSILLLPFNHWFPGFSIFRDSASFAVRHSAQISLLGVILALTFFIITILYSSRIKK